MIKFQALHHTYVFHIDLLNSIIENQIEYQIYLWSYCNSNSVAKTFSSLDNRPCRQFQRMAGLNVTGVVDRATVRKMQAPRCGVKDFIPPNEGTVSRDQPQSFSTLGKWKKPKLYATFSSDNTHVLLEYALVITIFIKTIRVTMWILSKVRFLLPLCRFW